MAFARAGLSAFAVAVYLVQVTSVTILMTWLFLRTQGSVFLAVLAHLTFNTAEAVVYGGLPKLAVAQERAVYLANVTLLAVLAAAVLWRLSVKRGDDHAAQQLVAADGPLRGPPLNRDVMRTARVFI